MIYHSNLTAIMIFVLFVVFVIGLSKYFASKTRSAEGYFAAGGQINWGVNGIAFAGDYLSAASFLGICGMIAFDGYDGFLYSIGYLAGWVVALFIVAEPMKRLGKYTFTDALDSKFNSKSIQLTAAISTLIVSAFYLIPQMVGAGDLVVPLLGLPHWVGVVMVGIIVTIIVATAGMASTTYVQFLKGGLLIIFSSVMVFLLLKNGLNSTPSKDFHKYTTLQAVMDNDGNVELKDKKYPYKVNSLYKQGKNTFVSLANETGIVSWWHLVKKDGQAVLEEAQSKTILESGNVLYNGEPKEAGKFNAVGNLSKIVMDGKEVEKTGPIGPFQFLATVNNSTVVTYKKIPQAITDGLNKVMIWYPEEISGARLMKPGVKFKIGSDKWMDKLNFISLMLALFFGTAALPHILIRYYTVPSQKDARKSTIVAIGAIGFFYILTLFMGIGAMAYGVLDVESSNMSAPLLARYFGVALFSIVSAIAFATVLGTVSGLIVAASGAVAHDLMNNYLNIKLTDKEKVKAGKIAAIAVGFIAIILGILFKGMNVSFLVGWAFAVAASANLPAILMLLFWKKTTAKGIAASIFVGIITAIGIILLSPSMWEKYGLNPANAPSSLDNPGIISIPLSFITLVIVSLLTQKDNMGLNEDMEEKTSSEEAVA
ncbi:MAG: cation acetate symporter [Lentisphaerae bacterium GWF2_44_16]|nr:MAG: cation acetate symporter [Lentisphaerae bacterium GWF2_44_16]